MKLIGNSKKIHFIGIGGIGMSGMAEFLKNHKFKISGSDITLSERINHLISCGIKISIGHKKENIKNCDLIIYSSAISQNNPEIIQGEKMKIPVIKRAELLGEMMKLKEISIAVSGTHGKTTTSSIIGNILHEANLDPTIITGGIIKKFNTNNISGSGNIIVVEADEYDKSFLSMSPTYSTINNIELEHLDIYEDINDLKRNFIKYANSIPFYGMISISNDSKYARDIIPDINKNIMTFGIDYDSDFMAKDIKFKNEKTFFKLVSNKTEFEVELSIPGKHNIYNALAAISICKYMNIKNKYIINGLKNFAGVKRRFDIKYINKLNENIFIDDYAHHPTEVKATIDSIKTGWPKRRLITIFQPHLFSRTKQFFKEFAQSLELSDIVILTSIYGARERNNKEISSKIILNELKNNKHKNSYLISRTDIPGQINKLIKRNDIIITMGAGDIYKTLDNIYNFIK